MMVQGDLHMVPAVLAPTLQHTELLLHRLLSKSLTSFEWWQRDVSSALSNHPGHGHLWYILNHLQGERGGPQPSCRYTRYTNLHWTCLAQNFPYTRDAASMLTPDSVPSCTDHMGTGWEATFGVIPLGGTKIPAGFRGYDGWTRFLHPGQTALL